MNDKRNLYFGVIGMVLGITLALTHEHISFIIFLQGNEI